MGNLVGCDQSVTTPAIFAPTGDVTLTAGSEVIGISTVAAVAAISPGAYLPKVSGILAIAIGAAAPAALTLAIRFNGGADIATFVVAPAGLVALTTVYIPFVLVGVNSASAWIGAGKIVELTLLGTTNASTLKQVGSSILVELVRGPNI